MATDRLNSKDLVDPLKVAETHASSSTSSALSALPNYLPHPMEVMELEHPRLMNVLSGLFFRSEDRRWAPASGSGETLLVADLLYRDDPFREMSVAINRSQGLPELNMQLHWDELLVRVTAAPKTWEGIAPDLRLIAEFCDHFRGKDHLVLHAAYRPDSNDIENAINRPYDYLAVQVLRRPDVQIPQRLLDRAHRTDENTRIMRAVRSHPAFVMSNDEHLRFANLERAGGATANPGLRPEHGESQRAWSARMEELFGADIWLNPNYVPIGRALEAFGRNWQNCSSLLGNPNFRPSRELIDDARTWGDDGSARLLMSNPNVTPTVLHVEAALAHPHSGFAEGVFANRNLYPSAPMLRWALDNSHFAAARGVFSNPNLFLLLPSNLGAADPQTGSPTLAQAVRIDSEGTTRTMAA